MAPVLQVEPPRHARRRRASPRERAPAGAPRWHPPCFHEGAGRRVDPPAPRRSRSRSPHVPPSTHPTEALLYAPRDPLDRPPANLAELLHFHATRTPGRVAVREGSRAATYGELWSRASATAALLSTSGVAPGDRVGLLLERGVDAAAAYFGILASGAVAVLVNTRYRPRQIEHAVGSAGVRLLITGSEMLARQPLPLELGARVVEMEEVPREGRSAPVPRVAGDVAQIVHTSGSTGMPKGVTFSHGNLWSGVQCVARYLGMEPEDRVMSLLPFSSVYGLNQLICTVAVGATLVVEASPLPQQIDARMREVGATVLAAVPPLWLQLLGTPRFGAEPIPSLRVLQNAGGHLPVAAVRALRAAQPHARLFLMYGQTETFRGSFLPPEEVDRRPGSMGRAVPGAELLLLRDDLTPCGPDEVGELVHRGPTVALGYWDDPEATARVFRPNPLRPAGTPDAERVVFSGDLARRDAEGFLYYVGRKDRMIKSMGFRVGPDEILDVLFASGEIREGVVSTEPDPTWGDRIVAYVVLAPGGALDRLQRFARTELPRHMQPARFEARTELPRTAAGKYDVAGVCEPHPR